MRNLSLDYIAESPNYIRDTNVKFIGLKNRRYSPLYLQAPPICHNLLGLIIKIIKPEQTFAKHKVNKPERESKQMSVAIHCKSRPLPLMIHPL